MRNSVALYLIAAVGFVVALTLVAFDKWSAFAVAALFVMMVSIWGAARLIVDHLKR